MQVCTPSQTTTPTSHHSVLLQAGCPSCCPTNSVKALKAFIPTHNNYQLTYIYNVILANHYSYCLFRIRNNFHLRVRPTHFISQICFFGCIQTIPAQIVDMKLRHDSFQQLRLDFDALPHILNQNKVNYNYGLKRVNGKQDTF